MSDENFTTDEIEAGLDIPVRCWNEMQLIAGNLAISANWYLELKKKLDTALLREPVNLAEITHARAMIDSRRHTHRQLLQRFYAASADLAEKLEQAQS